jgi:hypothetical protein
MRVLGAVRARHELVRVPALEHRDARPAEARDVGRRDAP